ncbi:hypothetical protein [Streptomyces sp. NPDC008121]|uniref:hypothetical protein n=1 Tax=Streptomyces sp. NPDC008121 TaxID=3364809 RepID=UPI0036E27148
MKNRPRIALPRILPPKRPAIKPPPAPADRERGTIPLREGWTLPDEWTGARGH